MAWPMSGSSSNGLVRTGAGAGRSRGGAAAVVGWSRWSGGRTTWKADNGPAIPSVDGAEGRAGVPAGSAAFMRTTVAAPSPAAMRSSDLRPGSL